MMDEKDAALLELSNGVRATATAIKEALFVVAARRGENPAVDAMMERVLAAMVRQNELSAAIVAHIAKKT